MAEILKDKVILSPVLLYIFQRITASLDGTPTMIVLDEAWALIDNPVFGPKIKDEVFSLPEKCSEPCLGGCAPPPSVVGIVGIHRLVLLGIHYFE